MESILAPISKVINMRISYDHYSANDDECKQYLADFEQTLFNYFMNELNCIISKKQKWSDNSFGIGIPGRDIDEMLHHCKIANDKCYDFTGREEMISNALQLILTDNNIFTDRTHGFR